MTVRETSIPDAFWPAKLLDMNRSNGHWRGKAELVKAWRSLGQTIGEQPDIGPEYLGRMPVPSRVWFGFRFPTAHKRDTGNLLPTCKAIVDGLVDAGVFSDDCDGIIEGPWPVRLYPNGPREIVLRLVPIVGPHGVIPDDVVA